VTRSLNACPCAWRLVLRLAWLSAWQRCTDNSPIGSFYSTSTSRVCSVSSEIRLLRTGFSNAQAPVVPCEPFVHVLAWAVLPLRGRSCEKCAVRILNRRSVRGAQPHRPWPCEFFLRTLTTTPHGRLRSNCLPPRGPESEADPCASPGPGKGYTSSGAWPGGCALPP